MICGKKFQKQNDFSSYFFLNKFFESNFFLNNFFNNKTKKIWIIQKHFLWIKAAPPSLYSFFFMYIGSKLSKLLNMLPPIQTDNFLYGGEIILIFIVEGARATISLVSLLSSYLNIEEPPAMTILPYNSFLTSMSHFEIDWKVLSCNPGNSFPILIGL